MTSTTASYRSIASSLGRHQSAVRGDAWFAVRTPDGTAYTRDGRVKMTESGELRSLNGYPMLDAGGSKLLLDGADGPPAIAADAMVMQNARQVGAIGLLTIPGDAVPTRADDSAVVPDEPTIAALNRAVADAGRYPAVDVLGSISRLAAHVPTEDQRAPVGKLRTMIARFQHTRDLCPMGGLQPGADAVDQAATLTPRIHEASSQAPTPPRARMPSTNAPKL